MTAAAWAIGGLASLVWLGLLLFWHGFWRADQRLRGDRAGDGGDWPSVTAVIPARNEADVIAQTVSGLLRQDYPGVLSIVVVDDSSEDGTAEAARAALPEGAGRVISAPPLEAGWAGKLWALRHGIAAARAGGAPDFFWLTDADIVHGPHVLRGLVAKACADRLALVSLMVRLPARAFWEVLLVPAFLFFFQLLYPFPAVNTPSSRIAGAAGGCVLLRADALAAIGGIAAIRNRLIDDCALGRAVKASGRRIWLGLADDSRSQRRYTELSEFWRMVVRSAFVQLRHSTVLLIVCVLGMALTYLAPPLLVLYWFAAGESAGLGGLVAWGLMSIAYWPTVRYCGLSPLVALSLPVAAVLFMAMTVHAAIRHWLGRGEAWKGRDYGTDT